MRNLSKTTLVAGAIGLALQANAINLTINNPSFEVPSSSNPFNTVFAVDSTRIPGWTVSAGSVDHIAALWVAADGSRSLDMSGSGAGTIYQQIYIPIAGTLSVDFSMAGNPYLGGIKHLEVSLVGAGQTFTFDTTGATFADMKWVQKTAIFNVPAAGNYNLQFASLDQSAYGPALDNISANIYGVPDGGMTLLLLGAGLTSLAAVRKRFTA